MLMTLAHLYIAVHKTLQQRFPWRRTVVLSQIQSATVTTSPKTPSSILANHRNMEDHVTTLKSLHLNSASISDYISQNNIEQYESNEHLAGRECLTDLDSGLNSGYSDPSAYNYYSSDESGSFTAGEFCPDSTFGESMCDDVVSELETSETSLTTGSPKRTKPLTKLLNILVYCGKKDATRKFTGIKHVLEKCINALHYTIYHMKHSEVKNGAWMDSTVLIVIASDHLYDDTDIAFLEYFKNGGNIISFGSPLDKHFIKRKMHTLTSTLNLIKISNPKNCKHSTLTDDISVIGSKYCYDIETVLNDKVKVTCLLEDKSADLPVIVKVTSKDIHNTGVVLLSQVYLDKDPSEMAAMGDAFRELKASNYARFALLSNLFALIGLNCDIQPSPEPTPVYLFTKSHCIKASLLDIIRPRLKNGLLRSETKSLSFPDITKDNSTASDAITKVYTENCDSEKNQGTNFDPKIYFSELTTKCLGNCLLYAEVLPTTMNMLDGLKFSAPDGLGLIVVAGQQTEGKGRGGNTWLSPTGCAMFSLHIKFPVDSHLGQRSPFMQHIAAMAAILSVRSLPGYQDLDLRLKWPNDIFFGNTLKLGGVIVNSTILGNMFHVIIGMGVNINNSDPTICLNDVILQHNIQHKCRLATISQETFIATTVSHIETLLDDFQQNGHEKFCDLYYRYWLHSNVKVTLESEDGVEVIIRGLDSYGYLEVETGDGKRLTVQPDGNSFDMMKNLIAVKTR